MLQDHLETGKMQWLASARAAARQLYRAEERRAGEEGSARWPPQPGEDPRVMGAVMQPREFQMIKFVESRRKACHGRHIGLFKLRS